MKAPGNMRALAGQTAIYGMSSIIGRLLNYLLVPLYTRLFTQPEYGAVSDLYALAGFLIVLLTYGMETAFFRFARTEPEPRKVYATALRSILTSSAIIVGLLLFFNGQIADALHYGGNREYIIFFALILGLDAITAIPFARLRSENRPSRFAFVKLSNIGINIGLNLFFLLLCPAIMGMNGGGLLKSIIGTFYSEAYGIGYIFLANLMASGITLLMLLPEMKGWKYGFDSLLWKRMLRYAWPLIIVGLAGIVNEMLDREMLKYLLPGTIAENLAQVGIYSACYKLSILMTLFVQAFRYAAEPFFFAQTDGVQAPRVYAQTMKYFTFAGTLIFLAVMFYIDIFQHFIGERFRSGLHIVPILLMANLFLGMYYTLSIWYKVTDKTRLGAWISVTGAVITVVLNVLFIPVIGYEASAWATLAAYGSMLGLSWWLGQRHYPVPYNIRKITLYLSVSLVLFFISYFLLRPLMSLYALWVVNAVLMGAYLALFWWLEQPGKMTSTN